MLRWYHQGLLTCAVLCTSFMLLLLESLLCLKHHSHRSSCCFCDPCIWAYICQIDMVWPWPWPITGVPDIKRVSHIFICCWLESMNILVLTCNLTTKKKNQLHHFLLEQVRESTDNCECSCPRQLLVEWLTAVWGFGIVERCYCRFILHILKVWRIKKTLHNYFPNLLFPLKVCMSFYSFVCFFWRKWQGHLKCALHSV